MKARQSLVRVTAGRYQKASKKEKRKILDEFVVWKPSIHRSH
jgi:hypothetical protein